MMSLLDSWLVWAGLGGGTIGLIVLAVVAPSVLQIITTFVSGAFNLALPLLKPVASAVGVGLGKALSALMTGFFRVLDDGKVIAFVASACLVTYGAGHYMGKHHTREQVIDELHQQFKFIPKR